MNEMAKIELSKEIIEPIIRAQLHASITAALGRSDQLIAQVVQTVMNIKVDEKGQTSSYSYARPLITWMAEDAIKQAAHEAIKEWFVEKRSEIKAEIITSLKKNMKGMAENFVLGLTNGIMAQHHSNITLTFDGKK